MKKHAFERTRSRRFFTLALLIVVAAGCAMKITALKPASGRDGDVITIEGEQLGDVDEVYFDGTLAPDFMIKSSDEIEVTVPVGATTGLVNVWDADAADGAASPYTFTVHTMPMQEEEPNNIMGSATLLQEATFGWGRVNKPIPTQQVPLNDIDWFKVESDELAWATTFEIRVSGRGNNPYPIDVQLFDSNNNPILDVPAGLDVTCWVTMPPDEELFIRLAGDDEQPRHARYRVTFAKWVFDDLHEADEQPRDDMPLFFSGPVDDPSTRVDNPGLREDVVEALYLGPSDKPAPMEDRIRVTRYYVGSLADLFLGHRWDPTTASASGGLDVFRVPDVKPVGPVELKSLVTLYALGFEPTQPLDGDALRMDLIVGGTTAVPSLGDSGMVELNVSDAPPGSRIAVGFSVDEAAGIGPAPIRAKRAYAILANILVTEDIDGSIGDFQ